MITATKKQIVTETVVLEMGTKEAQTLRDVLGATPSPIHDELGLFGVFKALDKIYPNRVTPMGYAIRNVY